MNEQKAEQLDQTPIHVFCFFFLKEMCTVVRSKSKICKTKSQLCSLINLRAGWKSLLDKWSIRCAWFVHVWVVLALRKKKSLLDQIERGCWGTQMAADGESSSRRGIGAWDGVTCTNVPLNVCLKCKHTRGRGGNVQTCRNRPTHTVWMHAHGERSERLSVLKFTVALQALWSQWRIQCTRHAQTHILALPAPCKKKCLLSAALNWPAVPVLCCSQAQSQRRTRAQSKAEEMKDNRDDTRLLIHLINGVYGCMQVCTLGARNVVLLAPCTTTPVGISRCRSLFNTQHCRVSLKFEQNRLNCPVRKKWVQTQEKKKKKKKEIAAGKPSV